MGCPGYRSSVSLLTQAVSFRVKSLVMPDQLMRPSELKRVQELLATIERATSMLKDELVKVRGRENKAKQPGKTLAEVFTEEGNLLS
jgi:GMP synthase PP-ATPase subunit